MREIKFRAYDADDKVMRSWEEIDFYKDIGDDYYLVGYKASAVTVKYDHEQIIMQYTGLKDKNGVEIYEGDIINVHWFYANHDPETLGVYEDETNLECVEIIEVRGVLGFYFEDDFLPLAFVPTHEESFEVIGNIYEDKELLEERGNAKSI